MLRIRPVPVDDPVLHELAGEAYTEMARRYPEEQPYPLPEAARYLLATLDGSPVGCCAVVPAGTGVAELKRMYVRPGQRGRGAARALLRSAERLAARLGAATMRLETGLRQPEAIRLYEAAGYRPIPAYPPYQDNPLSRCYAKSLPPATGVSPPPPDPTVAPSNT